jgi:hypothetical protein
MDLQETAKKIVKIAEQIEKEASDKSILICSECTHTASLTQINERRAKLAGDNYSVKPVTINEKVNCPVLGCPGIMSYFPTDASENFYVEEKVAAEGEGAPGGGIEDLLGESTEVKPEEEAPKAPKAPKIPKEEKPEEPKPEDTTGDIDVDDLFEDVETQNDNMQAEKAEKADTTQKARKERTDEQNRIDQEKDDEGLGIPPQKEPLATPPIKTEPSPEAVKEQPKEKLDIFEEEKPKKPKKKPEEIIKKDVPKFKSKEASDRYIKSTSRYAV